MTLSYAWLDSFMCVTWLIHVCDMTHSCVWRDSFTNDWTREQSKDHCVYAKCNQRSSQLGIRMCHTESMCTHARHIYAYICRIPLCVYAKCNQRRSQLGIRVRHTESMRTHTRHVYAYTCRIPLCVYAKCNQRRSQLGRMSVTRSLCVYSQNMYTHTYVKYKTYVCTWVHICKKKKYTQSTRWKKISV